MFLTGHRRYVPALFALMVWHLFRPLELMPQTISVSLGVTEDTKGLFYSAFAGAIRSLGDVVLVEPEEEPEYNLHVVVLCEDGDCDDSDYFSVSVQLTEPFQWEDGFLGAYKLMPADEDRERAAQFADTLLSTFRDFERVRRTTVASWGRRAYRTAIQEFVAEVDHRCFEGDRIQSRMGSARRAGNQEALDALVATYMRRIEDDVYCY